MDFKKKLLLVLLAGGLLISLPSSLWARISNEGNEPVGIRIFREGSPAQATILFPGQTVSLPEDAVEIQVVPSTNVRGDESVEVVIIEADGTTGTIEAFGGTHKLGQGRQGKKDDAPVAGSAENMGNINVNLFITKQNAQTSTRLLLIGETVRLLPDTKEVRVKAFRTPRSDENVEVKIEMPDGRSHTVTRDGGIVQVKEKKKKGK